MAVERAMGRPELPTPGSSPAKKVLRAFRAGSALALAKPLGTLGGVLILLLVLTALFAPAFAPYDPLQIHSADRLQPPSLRYPLGTDDFGRDILSRVIYGARISMLIGLGAVAISVLLATIIGVISGYFAGRLDAILQCGVDTPMAFPWLVVLLTIMAILYDFAIDIVHE